MKLEEASCCLSYKKAGAEVEKLRYCMSKDEHFLFTGLNEIHYLEENIFYPKYCQIS